MNREWISNKKFWFSSAYQRRNGSAYLRSGFTVNCCRRVLSIICKFSGTESRSVTLPSSNDSWQRLQQPRDPELRELKMDWWIIQSAKNVYNADQCSAGQWNGLPSRGFQSYLWVKGIYSWDLKGDVQGRVQYCIFLKRWTLQLQIIWKNQKDWSQVLLLNNIKAGSDCCNTSLRKEKSVRSLDIIASAKVINML